MNGLNAPISILVKKLGDKIDFLQPMIESISNSLEANAKNIKIKVYIDPIENLTGKTNKIISYDIEDDGDGFTKENINSFLTYMSEHKLKLGCRGVGRITWLKVFKNVIIESYTKSQNIVFQFDDEFSSSRIKPEETNNKITKTIIKFRDVRNDFFLPGKKDLRTDADLNLIRHIIEEKFLIKLTLLNSSSKQFNIKIYDNKGNSTESISNNNIKSLKQKKFCIIDNRNKKIDFCIYYSFYIDEKQKNSSYLCANGRTVEKIPEKISFTKLPDNKSSIILVTSPFFDEHVKDERDSLDIAQSENTLNYGLSRDIINNKLEYEIENILIEEFPRLEEDNKRNRTELMQDYPFLAKQFREDKSKIVNKEKMLTIAKRKFEQEKEETSNKFKELLEQNDLDSKEFYRAMDEVTSMAARELAEYVVYRQQIISALERTNINNEKREKILHNLFMKMGTQSSNETLYDSNLWLFDDKFMTYVYAASNKTIKKIKEYVGNDNIESKKTRGRLRPDMAVFFSRNTKDSGKIDAIIIEFKACGAKYFDKSTAISELRRNAYALREEVKNIDNIWCYAITKFDDELIRELISADFESVFTNYEKNQVFRNYFKNVNAHCYFISLDALISDAKVRNNIFLDIIRNK